MDIPKFADDVVFPTPPFPDVTTIVRVSPLVFLFVVLCSSRSSRALVVEIFFFRRVKFVPLFASFLFVIDEHLDRVFVNNDKELNIVL